MKPGALLALAILASGASAAPPSRSASWVLDGEALRSSGASADSAAAVGSLQKPFVAEAWARAHPGTATPRFVCEGGHACWLRAGHGSLGLSRATSLSCNSYFRQLAAEVSPELLSSTLQAAGFRVAGPISPAAAIGLDEPPGIVSITPRALLEAYRDLTRIPWLAGDGVRREVLAGLRSSALEGTAQALDRRGYWAKTGTVARTALPGTVGWALAVDDTGFAGLARVEPAAGREAAAVLGERLEQERPGSVARGLRGSPTQHVAKASPDSALPSERVRVRLFARLALEAVYARNLGNAPVHSAGGFVGPGGSVTLRPGVRLAESVWEIHVPKARLVRVVKADLGAELDEAGALRIVAGMERREYASGVVAAELGHADADTEAALGAAVLRFLGRGPRHQGFDVCDSTHCAFFIGRGPRTQWLEPDQATAVGGVLRPLDDGLWQRARTLAEGPGPDHWTSHCGGQPLSAHAVWANGDRSVQACALHGPSSARPWRRAWSDRDLERAFGSDVRALRVRAVDGVWRLEVTRDAGDVGLLLYDDAHRRLAAGLGWGSLPSPAERVFRSAGGWQAEGVGLGHRVGLCLGAAERRLALLDPGVWPRPDRDADPASGDGS